MASGRADKILILGCALYLLGVASGLVLLLGFVDSWWPATLLAFGPRWPLAAAAVPILAYAAWRRNRRVALAVTIAGLLAAGPYMGLCLPVPRSQAEGAGRAITVASYNIQERRIDDPRVERVVRQLNVDVLALQECRSGKLGELELYELHVATVFGLCLFSRFPIVAIEGRDPKDAWERNGSGAIMRVTLDVDGRHLHVLVLHLATVRDGLEALRYERFGGVDRMLANIELRRWESEIARAWGDAAKGPMLVMGDLNMPVESAIYRRYWGDLSNAFDECGSGLGHTKHTRLFGVRIDHVLMNDALRCDAIAVGEHGDSDHSPIVATLTLRAP
jgi:vancomycin resistance protein VanJ